MFNKQSHANQNNLIFEESSKKDMLYFLKAYVKGTRHHSSQGHEISVCAAAMRYDSRTTPERFDCDGESDALTAATAFPCGSIACSQPSGLLCEHLVNARDLFSDTNGRSNQLYKYRVETNSE